MGLGKSMGPLDLHLSIHLVPFYTLFYFVLSDCNVLPFYSCYGLVPMVFYESICIRLVLLTSTYLYEFGQSILFCFMSICILWLPCMTKIKHLWGLKKRNGSEAGQWYYNWGLYPIKTHGYNRDNPLIVRFILRDSSTQLGNAAVSTSSLKISLCPCKWDKISLITGIIGNKINPIVGVSEIHESHC